jgi:hypothetical protein
MPSRSIFSILVTAFLAVQAFLLVPPARAQSNNGNFIFLLASGFLCEPGDSSTCPATAKGNQGDSYEMSGAGTFDAQSKSAKAAGTFSHKSPNGNVLETGVWVASELVSFASYGVAPSALPHLGVTFGPLAIGPKRMPTARGPMPTGGLAVFRVVLLPLSGPRGTGVLEVNCALGEVPRERSVEGIRLTLERNNTEFSEEVGGRVMFLSMRPEVSEPVNAPPQEKVPETPEQRHN